MRERSPARPYKSRYAEETWVTPAQFLAEGMVARQARKEGTELPMRFWEHDRWKRAFLLQLRQANSLLKTYSADAVIRALRTQKGKTVYSLGAQFILDPLVKREQEVIDRARAAAEAAPPPPPPPVDLPPEPPRPAFVREQSPLSKLRGL